jgi:hypothetical protein
MAQSTTQNPLLFSFEQHPNYHAGAAIDCTRQTEVQCTAAVVPLALPGLQACDSERSSCQWPGLLDGRR